MSEALGASSLSVLDRLSVETSTLLDIPTLMNSQPFRSCVPANFGPLRDSYDYQHQSGEPHPEEEQLADQGMPSSSVEEYGSRSTPARENSRHIQNYLHQEEEPKPETEMLEHQFLSFSLLDRDGPGSEHAQKYEVGFGRSRDACSSSFSSSPAPAYNSNPIIASSSSPIRTSASNSNPSTSSSSFSSNSPQAETEMLAHQDELWSLFLCVTESQLAQGIGEQEVEEAEKHEALAMRMSACRCSIGSGVYLAIAELAFDMSGHDFWEFSSANFSMSTVRWCPFLQSQQWD